MADSVTNITKNYLLQHPGIRSCLLRGLINYSALAREICDSEQIDCFDAIVAACRRYKARVKKSEDSDKAIVKLIKNSRLKMTNKISVAIVEKPRDFEAIFALQRKIRKERGIFQFIEGEEAVTLILETQEFDQIRGAFAGKIKRVTHQLTQILMIFSQSIETTPGVISHIFNLLGANGINILEEMSCWTDVMIIVSEKDAALAAQLLA